MTLQDKIAKAKEMAATTGKSIKECMAIVSEEAKAVEPVMGLVKNTDKKSAKRWAKRDANKEMRKEVQAKFDNMTASEFDAWKENQKAIERMAQRPSSMR